MFGLNAQLTHSGFEEDIMKERTAWIDRAYATAEARRDLEKERFVQEVTAALQSALTDSGTTQAEIASRLQKTPAYVSQVLSGRRNCTLHTVAELAWASGLRLGVQCEFLQPLSHQAFKSTSNVLSIRRIAIRQRVRAQTPSEVVHSERQSDATHPMEIVA